MKSSSLKETIDRIGTLNQSALAEARARQDTLTKPAGSLGVLEDISVQLAGIYGQTVPHPKNKVIVLAAADHGVVSEGVSAYPQAVTEQMVLNFLRGGAAINVLAKKAGAKVVIVDAGVAAQLPSHPHLVSLPVGKGTDNMKKGPAMSIQKAMQCLEHGISIVNSEIEKGADIVGTGEMGIGNTTSASAITSVITGKSPIEVTGLGTGITEEQRKHKCQVIKQAIELNKPEISNGLDILAKVGGFEIGVLAGVMLGAAAARKPVILDGFISGSAALIAYKICPGVKDYFIAAHFSVEPGHSSVLEYLNLNPVLDLRMRLGEGSGAALSMMLVDAAAACLAEMATFSEAGVSEKEGS